MSVPKIDLDNIEITSNARFYKLKKPLTKTKIKIMFDDIVEQKKGHGKKIIDPLRDNTRNRCQRSPTWTVALILLGQFEFSVDI